MADLSNDIEKYLRGEMTPAEMHALEQKALNDPFLAEALEGAQLSGPEAFYEDVAALRDAVKKKTRKRGGIITINGSMQLYFGIAASLLLLAVSSFIVINMMREQKRNAETMALNAEDHALLADSVLRDSANVLLPQRRNMIALDQSSSQQNPASRRQDASGQVLAPVRQNEIASRDEQEVEVALSEPPVVLRQEEAVKDAVPSGKTAGTDAKRKSAQSPAATAPLTGRVLSTEVGEVVPGALVRIKETNQTAVADEQGRFTINALPGQTLNVAMLGLKSTEVVVPENSARLDVLMDTDVLALSEVVVTAQGLQKETKSLGYSVSSLEKGLVQGRVSGPDGVGVPGVNVVLKGTSTGAVTDANGRFSIPASEGSMLVFSFIGYATEERKIEDVSAPVNVSMQDDVAQLSEIVVVAGSGVTKKEEDYIIYQMAIPEGGFRAFRKYLEKAIRYPQDAAENKIEGKVTLEFTVTTNGELTNFKIIKSIGYGCDEALINAVRNGPGWNPSTRNNRPASEVVRVRYNFKLP